MHGPAIASECRLRRAPADPRHPANGGRGSTPRGAPRRTRPSARRRGRERGPRPCRRERRARSPRGRWKCARRRVARRSGAGRARDPGAQARLDQGPRPPAQLLVGREVGIAARRGLQQPRIRAGLAIERQVFLDRGQDQRRVLVGGSRGAARRRPCGSNSAGRARSAPRRRRRARERSPAAAQCRRRGAVHLEIRVELQLAQGLFHTRRQACHRQRADAETIGLQQADVADRERQDVEAAARLEQRQQGADDEAVPRR